MQGIDAHSGVTYQGSRVFPMTTCSTLVNTPGTHRSQIIIFPKHFKPEYISSQFQVLQAVLGNCSLQVWIAETSISDKFSSFFQYSSFGCTQFEERKSKENNLVVLFCWPAKW